MCIYFYLPIDNIMNERGGKREEERIEGGREKGGREEDKYLISTATAAGRLQCKCSCQRETLHT